MLATQLEFDSQLAATLERMADRMEEKGPTENNDFKDPYERSESAVWACYTEVPHHSIAMELKTFLALSHTAENLVNSLANEVLWDSLFHFCKR
jgi:hypothetical protein